MHNTYYIGIDLAWSHKAASGLCIMDNQGEVKLCEAEIWDNRELINRIKPWLKPNCIIGIDAPILVKNQKGSRIAERDLVKSRIHGKSIRAFMTNRDFFVKTYGSVRGEELCEELIRNFDLKRGTSVHKESNIIMECFPSGNVAGLFPDLYPIKHKLKAKIDFQTNIEAYEKLHNYCLAERLKALEKVFAKDLNSLKKKEYKSLEDKLDAFLICLGILKIKDASAKEYLFGESETGIISLSVSELFS